MQLPVDSNARRISQEISQEISQVISQITAPAFPLSAVASLLSAPSGRMSRIVDRSRAISALASNDPRRPGLGACFLVIIAYPSALLDISHEHGAAALFILAMSLSTAALAYLAREVRFSGCEIDRLE